MIEASPARSRYVRQHAIQHQAVIFIDVEILIYEVPQEAPCLRDPGSISALHWRNRLIAVLQIRDKITDSCQSKPHHNWILRRVNKFVNLSRMKSAVQTDVVGIVH